MDFKDIVKVVKQENGGIDLVNADGNVFKNVPPVGILEVTQNQKMLQIRQQNDASIYIAVDQLEATQILLNAEVPFDSSTSTVFDLLELMRTSFFFDLTDNGNNQPGEEYIERYFYTVDVTNLDTYPFLIHTEPIPLDNAISFEVDYIGFRTDTTAIGKRQSLAKYAANDGGTISVAATAASLTSSNYGITASIVQNGSNLELQIDGAGGDVTYNFWLTIRKIKE